jgi:preprotein translocase SecY subunit
LIGGIQNIGRIPELQRRILFTFGMLAVYRVGAIVATPGINPDVVRETFQRLSGTAFSLFNVFSGGALEQLSIFALGIMPYISASIIMQLLTVVVPSIEALKKEGEQGHKKITQYTRYGTIILSLFQSFLIATALESGQFGAGAVLDPGLGFRLMCMITLTSGTAFIMWLGEQITERGIGNGISLVIFSGIIVQIPSALGQLVELLRTDQFSLLQVLFLFGFIIVLTGFVVFVERGQRRIPIQHARRVVGRRVTQGGMSYFPLRVNTANVIPPIFASSLLIFPSTIGQFTDLDRHQPRRRGGQHQALGGLHPRNSARQADCGTHRYDPQPDHLRGSDLRLGDLRGSGVSLDAVRGAILLRRDRSPHRGRCRPRCDRTDRGPSGIAPVRGLRSGYADAREVGSMSAVEAVAKRLREVMEA